jgi:C-terminal processing protease CtpA/Prc
MLATFPIAPVLVIAATFTALTLEEEKGYIGVMIKASDDGGLLVNAEPVEDTPAAKAGIKENDRIIKLNGEAIDSLQGFVEKMRGTKPGTEIKLTIVRDKEEKEIKLKVGKFPKDLDD